jgi:thiol-disulfide isomerase/thioredoxin
MGKCAIGRCRNHLLLLLLLLPIQPVCGAEAPSVKLALTFRPIQRDVEIARPTETEYARCRVEVERRGQASGWVVLGPSGQILRRFVDTNADNVVDQWRYFQNGLEVYRDVDSNFNNKVDQSRWLNKAGTRWGIDTDEDGWIDRWKSISAEESCREAVMALIQQDPRRMARVLIDASDMEALEIVPEVASQLSKAVADPRAQMQTILSSTKTIRDSTRWSRFDNAGLFPAAISSDAGKAKRDLIVYQSAMGLVDTDGQTGLVQIGELVRVGDAWKLTQLPRPIEGDSVTSTGVLMQPGLPTTGGPEAQVASNLTPAMKKTLTELQELDRKRPAPTASQSVQRDYYRQRTALLQRLANASKTESDREQWMRQLVDGLVAAVQTGADPEGLQQLSRMDSESQARGADSKMAAYVKYRYALASYSREIQQATAQQRQDVQARWMKQLQEFVEAHPLADDAPDALLQLAITQEFAGKRQEAQAWYQRLAAGHPQTVAGQRGAGALTRLGLQGKSLNLVGSGLDGTTIDLAGSGYRGRPILVMFWATWCRPCTEDLPQIQALYQQYHSQGFEVVGINLDVDSGLVSKYLSEQRVVWPQIREDGGLESPPAIRYGVVSLPTMFLVDRAGVVVSSRVTVADLKNQLPQLLKK